MIQCFALWTLPFWALIVIATISIVALIENEYNFWADVVFVVSLALLYQLGCSQPLSSLASWVVHNPLSTFLIFIGYLFAGTVYSLIKWAMFMVDTKKYHLKINKTYYPENWKPGEHKAKITHWMIYWPISGLWTLMSNPVAKAFNRIFDEFEGVYQRITDKIMKELVDKQSKK